MLNRSHGVDLRGHPSRGLRTHLGCIRIGDRPSDRAAGTRLAHRRIFRTRAKGNAPQGCLVVGQRCGPRQSQHTSHVVVGPTDAATDR